MAKIDREIIFNDTRRRPGPRGAHGRPGMCRGIKYYDDGLASGIAWIAFPEPLDELTALERSGFYPAHYNGPGQPFTRHPDIWSTKRRNLVTQEFGWDI